MGRLLRIHACPVCNYYVEDELHEGSSGIAPDFIRNRYAIATCHHCHNVVSVFIPSSAEQIQNALQDTRDAIDKMQSDMADDDIEVRDRARARDLLPLFQETLDYFDDPGDIDIAQPGNLSVCTMCGSKDIEIPTDITSGLFDDSDAWIRCPVCEEGRLLIETSGFWD
jgi:hypothetical protein